MDSKVQQYYDIFSSHLLKSYIRGDRRTICLRVFLRGAISRCTDSILEIGCGVGANAIYIARRIAPFARILAIDISRKNIELAKLLFEHKNVTFDCLDATESDIARSRFSVIVMPDVYEHIPVHKRPALHSRIANLLAENGKVIITLPYPLAQDAARREGKNLQIIDEPVLLEDLLKFADDIQGTLTYYALVSADYTNEYVHAIIEKGIGFPSAMESPDRLAIKRAPRRSSYLRYLMKLKRKVLAHFRKRYVNARLKRLA